MVKVGFKPYVLAVGPKVFHKFSTILDTESNSCGHSVLDGAATWISLILLTQGECD